ncbi:stalk domain-containing protein [Paenibacillus piri]|nr:stalk domain-containing protein [Paenibacillus piri]
MRSSLKKISMILTCSLMIPVFAAVSQVASAAASTVTIDGYDYQKESVDGLNHFNSIREKMGLQKLKLDPFVQKAVDNHTGYLIANNFTFEGSLSAHIEDSNKKNYTGSSVGDRLRAVGFLPNSYWGASEDVVSNTPSIETGITGLLSSPYHRTPLMHPDMSLFGFSFKDGLGVLNIVRTAKPGGISVYPYDGQKDVPVSFDGRTENPNPLTQFGLKESGYVISYMNAGNSPSDVKATIKDSKGQSVDFFKFKDSDNWHLVPKKELAYNETYTVTAEGKTWSFTTVSNDSSDNASSEYSKEIVEALSYLNNVRQKSGLSQVKLNPYLVKASENHASYLVTNNMTTLDTFSHRESPSLKGFTGERARDRAYSVGGESTFKYHAFDEGIFLGTSSIQQAIDLALDMSYHRDPLVDPNLDQVGVAINGKTVVLVYAIKGQNSQTSVYPYDGQTNVPLSFDGTTESPNPLKQFGVNTSGFVISYKEYNSPDYVKATLKNSKGESVDFYLENAMDKGWKTWFIYPKKDLASNETYTVTVNNKTWSFTTASSGSTTPNPPTKPPIVDQKPPRKFSANDVGVRLDGKYIELSPKAKVVNGSTFIPLRGVFEAMGAKIGWESAPSSVLDSLGRSVKPDFQGIVTITKDSTRIELYVGTTKAFVNGRAATLSVASFISAEGSTYVPLRFVSEALGADVDWEADNWTAVIKTDS